LGDEVVPEEAAVEDFAAGLTAGLMTAGFVAGAPLEGGLVAEDGDGVPAGGRGVAAAARAAFAATATGAVGLAPSGTVSVAFRGTTKRAWHFGQSTSVPANCSFT
jgi:hypothetical protein